MYKLLLTVMLVVSLSNPAVSQITYGKEDCGDLFSNWIEKLDQAKPTQGEALGNQHFIAFNRWLNTAKKDITEARYNVLRKTETENLFLNSVINVLHNPAGGVFGPGFSAVMNYKGDVQTTAASFFDNLNTVSSPVQNLVHSLNFPFRVYSTNEEVEASRKEGMFMLFEVEYENKDYERCEINRFYKYLLDLVEFNRENPFDDSIRIFYKTNYKLFSYYTALPAPEWSDTKNVKAYLRFFSHELLYGFGRYIEYMINDKKKRSPLSLEAYKGTLGDNRYVPDYYKKLLASQYRASIERIIQHIIQLKNNCAPAGVLRGGSIKIETGIHPIEQQNVAEIAPPRGVIEGGKGRLLVIRKTSDGRYFLDDHYGLFYTDAQKKFYSSPYVNQYCDLNPGHYMLRSTYIANDSMLVDIIPGETKVISLPEKGCISGKLIDREGKETTLRGIRIYLLQPDKTTAYKTDTIFVDLWNTAWGPRDVNAGLYRVGLLLPEKYYPAMVYAEEPVEVQAHSDTKLIVSGFGALTMNTPDGLGKRKDVRIDIFTAEKNSKSGEYTQLVRAYSYDTLNIRPGKYRVQMGYAFPIIREIEIQSGHHVTEPIDNLGALLVTNGLETREWVEITDDVTKKWISVRNNSTVDLETDRTYTVKVVRANNEPPRVFPAVVVKAGQLTTVNWKN